MIKHIDELIQKMDRAYLTDCLKQSYKKKCDILDCDENSLVEIQESLKHKISKESKLKNIKVIAGVDLAYFKVDDKEFAVCVIVIIDYMTGNILGFVSHIDKITQKYIPSCLAFREIPIFLTTSNKIKDELNIEVDVYMFDGNGYLHPRNMGLATHAGIILNKPTFGVAKSYFKVDNTNFIMPENLSGATTSILIKGEVYGVAYRSHKGIKPIFISTGNHIDLKTAINITSNMLSKESRIPSPTRYADKLANRIREEVLMLL
ncbi:MAG: endonuclease V [bacterium]